MSRRTLAALAICLMIGTALSAASREDEAKKYAKDLKSKDAKIRLTAVQELGKLGSIQHKLIEPYIDNVVNVLKDTDAKVRGEAARTLGLMDPPEKKEMIDKVAGLLKDEKSEIAREGMENGLGSLGALATEPEAKKAALDALTAAAKNADKKEMQAIKAARALINPPKKKKV